MNTLKSIIKHLSNGIFIAVIIAFVLVTALSVLSYINMNQDRLMFGSYGFGRVVTGSMEPDISTGSFILIKKADPSTLNEGDVIMFRSDDPTVPQDAPVSHQIIRIETDRNGIRSFITKGTANPIEDTYPVYDDDIIGVIVYSSSFIGSVIGISQSAYIYPVLIALLLLSMIHSIIDIIRQICMLNKEQHDLSE